MEHELPDAVADINYLKHMEVNLTFDGELRDIMIKLHILNTGTSKTTLTSEDLFAVDIWFHMSWSLNRNMTLNEAVIMTGALWPKIGRTFKRGYDRAVADHISTRSEDVHNARKELPPSPPKIIRHIPLTYAWLIELYEDARAATVRAEQTYNFLHTTRCTFARY